MLGDGVDLVIKPPAEALDQMGDFVRTMHEKSGLLAELDGGMTLAEAEQQVLAYVKEHCPDGSRPPLAGNTVATDRSFLSRDMPDLEGFLHYRIVDVSSIKELARRWFPRAYFQAPTKRGNHRALADIQESIEELRYYREAVFVPQPRPGQRRGARPSPRSTAARSPACPWPRPRRPSSPAPIPIPRNLPDSPTTSCRPRDLSGPHGGCSSAGRAPRCGRGCRGFKSRHSPQAAPRHEGGTGGRRC